MIYNRVAKLNIEGRVFKYDLSTNDRFAIEFSTDFDIAKVCNTATIKLYNVNDETIESARPKKIGLQKQFKTLSLEAGYKDNFGIILAGEIFDVKISKNGVDRVLELNVSSNISKFINTPINKTYQNKSTSYIVKDILQAVGFDNGGIEPETEINYPSITINDMRAGLKRLAKDSGSEMYLSNNSLFFKKPSATNEAIELNFKSGLLQEPEKTDTGYSVKSLFNYRIIQGNKVVVKGKKEYTIKVNRGKHEFSTFGQALTTFEGTEVK